MILEQKKKWNPALYNNGHAFVYEFGAQLIDLLDPQKGERILDLGCGSGQLTQQLSDKGAEVTGVDYSEQMIEDAKARYPDLAFYVMNAENFEFEQPFDAIFSNATLHWVLEKEKAIDCIYKNLRPGGRMVIEFGGKGNVEQIVNATKEQLLQKGYDLQAKKTIWYFPALGEYARLLEEKGFRVHMAFYFDRPTDLGPSEEGIVKWLEMFGDAFFENISVEDKTDILKNIVRQLRPKLYKEGTWLADYKRLRILATRN